MFSTNKKFSHISPADAKQRLTSGDKVFLIDVRTTPEYAENHIPNSISIPLANLKSKFSKITKILDSEIIVYCQSGMRAEKACSELVNMGYTNIKNLGGIASWPYQTTKGK
jgi:phage shock protein E